MTQDTDSAVRLTRNLDAPRNEVWRMWTDPAEFAAWYGPDGATVEVTQWELYPGGGRLVAIDIETPRGPMTMRFTGEFVEVTKPARLVYTEAMTDDPHSETRVEVHFQEDRGRTTVDLTHHGIPAGSPGETGWAMALDHLATRILSA